MKIRVITSIAALAVFAGVLFAPPIIFTIVLAAVIFVMLYECYNATKADTLTKSVGFISALLIMFAIWTIVSGNFEKNSYIAPCGAIIITILMYMLLVIREHGKKTYSEILSSGFLTMYIVISTGCIWLAKEHFGISNMLLIFVCAWMCDTCAYLVGITLGKRKLIPRVSPKKTVEGAIGGVLGAIIGCILYLFIINNIMGINTIWSNILIEGGIIGLIGGVLSQFGDLTASSIKRDGGIKDFGRIFPGHGGFMDRFDSVIFIAPVMYGIMFALAIGILA